MTVDQFIVATMALVLLCLCCRASMRLLYARGPAVDDSVYMFMRIFSWGLVLAPAAVMTLVTVSIGMDVFNATTGSPFVTAVAGNLLLILSANWLTLLCIAVLLEAAFELVMARRAVQRQAAWRLVAASLASRRSPIESLRFHEARFSGIVGRWYRRLVDDLERGVAWPLAIWQNRRAFPREASAQAAMLDLAARPPQGGFALDEMADPAFQEARQVLVQRSVYVGTVCVIIAAVLAFVMIKIVPSFQAIFADFDLELPPVTNLLIAFSAWFERYVGVPVGVLAVALTLGVLISGLCYLCDLPVLRPLTDRLTFFRHRAQVLRLLAAGFDRGKPVDAALQQLIGGWSRYPSRLVRRRLAEAHARVQAGDPWQDALQRSSLLSAGDAAVLRAAQPVGNVPWAMRMLADRKMRLAVFRLTIGHQFAFAAIAVLLALFVLWTGVALIYPLAQLVIGLAQ